MCTPHCFRCKKEEKLNRSRKHSCVYWRRQAYTLFVRKTNGKIIQPNRKSFAPKTHGSRAHTHDNDDDQTVWHEKKEERRLS